MSDATLAIANLAEKLISIATVRIGRTALETTSAILPVITIWSTGDAPATDQGYGAATQYTRSVVIEATISAKYTAYHEDLDAMLTKIRSAISYQIGQPLLGGYALAIRQNGAQFFAPEPNGITAVVQLTLEFDYLERN